jgi:fructosamine-3-kinase
MDLKESGNIQVPLVLQQGLWQQQQFFLLQWIDSAATSKDFWQSFGHSLAAMHRNTADFFGWKEDNYIGTLFQTNTKQISWDQFFIQSRIKPMLQLLADTGKFSEDEYNNALAFCNTCSGVFPKEPPALLHGDLWRGNFMANKDGEAVLYDPAVYYGHREMDIGMTKLFGGFPAEFYTAYQQVYPLATGWEQRLPLAQLYPVLVHAVLFGGHYILQAKDIMQQFI